MTNERYDISRGGSDEPGLILIGDNQSGVIVARSTEIALKHVRELVRLANRANAPEPSLVLHVLRNPHGWSVEAITAARLQAADEIEGAHHDIDRLMAACTAEANEVERLRAHLRDIGSLATPEDSADDERQFARMREMVLAALSGSHEPGAHLSAGWVSLGERKPANMELELVFDQTDGEVYLARFMMYDQHRYEFALGDGTVLDLHSVTHWMPLPEPPPSRTGE